MITKNRLHNLDYLRGIAAFSIMIYHFWTWSYFQPPAETFLGRIGIYGVSIFYVLSGLTLFYVYRERLKFNFESISQFFRKRFFRIYPLLWLIIILSVVLQRKMPEIDKLLLNITGLFGFFAWDKYYGTGVWSIGNELVFYAFFPFFMLFARKSKVILIATGLLLFSIYCYFAFNIMQSHVSLSEQWSSYVNPLNQVFLFFGGFLIGYLFYQQVFNNRLVSILLVASILAFIFYPVHGDAANLVTGFNRMAFTVFAFLICFSFFKWTVTFPKLLHVPLTTLGEASYSVYLVHPIIYTVIGVFSSKIFRLEPSVHIIMSIVFTLFFSYYIYQYFEKYFMRFGSKKKI